MKKAKKPADFMTGGSTIFTKLIGRRNTGAKKTWTNTDFIFLIWKPQNNLSTDMKNSFQATLRKHERIIGGIASLLSIIMFFSLIEIFISNIRGESRIFVQPLATAFNGLFWSLYAR